MTSDWGPGSEIPDRGRPQRSVGGCGRIMRGMVRTMLVLCLGLAGCAPTNLSLPDRSATEQFLLSAAARRAVEQLSVTALRDRAVFIVPDYFETYDEPFFLGELRAHLLVGGVRLVAVPEEAEVIVEARSGGLGIDYDAGIIGVPGTKFTPEVAILKNSRLSGFASVSLVAYWRDTGEVVTASGPHIGQSERTDWWIFGSGPRSAGDIPTIRSGE